jgi:hypothetical protein
LYFPYGYKASSTPPEGGVVLSFCWWDEALRFPVEKRHAQPKFYIPFKKKTYLA